MNLILLSLREVDNGLARLVASDPRANYILRHLKKQPNSQLRVGFIEGPTGLALISESKDGAVTLEIDQNSLREPPTRAQVEVFLGLPFPKALKRLWAVFAQFGVSRICVFRGELSDLDHTKATALTPEIYEPLILEGLAQSGVYTHLPQIDIWHDRKISDVLSTLDAASVASEVRLLFDVGDFPKVHERIGEHMHRHRVQSRSSLRAVLAIGPERGWTDNEATQFQAAGFSSVSIGNSVLKTDVACIAALVLVLDALSDTTRTLLHCDTSTRVETALSK